MKSGCASYNRHASSDLGITAHYKGLMGRLLVATRTGEPGAAALTVGSVLRGTILNYVIWFGC